MTMPLMSKKKKDQRQLLLQLGHACFVARALSSCLKTTHPFFDSCCSYNMCTIYKLQLIHDSLVHFPFANEEFNNCSLILFIHCGRKKTSQRTKLLHNRLTTPYDMFNWQLLILVLYSHIIITLIMKTFRGNIECLNYLIYEI